MRFFRLIAALGVAVAVVGCAHPIDIAPDSARIQAPTGVKRPIRMGLHIPAQQLALEVTTPGGGGDNVRYFPYRSIGDPLKRVLEALYESVVPLSGPELPADVDYVLVPFVVTNSGGSNFFTWPPETFTVDLAASIKGKDGKTVAGPRVVGSGTATTQERLGGRDFGFAGRRAMEDALSKLAVALQTTELGPPQAMPTAPPSPRPPSVAERLAQLRELLDKGLISQGEYESKRRGILSAL
jgi:hypothetical protein